MVLCCPRDFDVQVKTSQVCRVDSAQQLGVDVAQGHNEYRGPIYLNSYEGTCELTLTVKGFEQSFTQQLLFDAPLPRETETRQREKPSASTGGSQGGSGFDYD